jgi:hypothetical protein
VRRFCLFVDAPSTLLSEKLEQAEGRMKHPANRPPIGGASVNLIFLNHFQRMAQAHFTIRRLERKYGRDVIRHEYERLAG